MPSIYLSPTSLGGTPYPSGKDEEYYMNQIADAMIPYLRANDISFSRNNPGDTLTEILDQSNAQNYDLHLSLRSNTSPERLVGVMQGPDVYYHAYSKSGQQAAALLGENLTSIYPHQSLVSVIPSTTLKEVIHTSAPSVYMEIAYHDNKEDEDWIINHIDDIAQNIVLSLTQYFHLPFQPVQQAVKTR